MQKLPFKVDHKAGTITKLFTNLTYPFDSQSVYSTCQDSFQSSSIMQVDRKQNTGYDSEAKQQIRILQALKETLIGSYLMGTDVKYLCKPISVSKQPWSIIYKLGIPFLTSNDQIKTIFEFTEIKQYFDFVYCICGMLIQLVQHGIFHTCINVRNIIYTGPSSRHEMLCFQLIDYGDAFFFQDLEEGKFNKQSKLQLLFLDLKKQQMTNPKSLKKYLVGQMVQKGFDLVKTISDKFVISKEQNVWLSQLKRVLKQELISYVEKSKNNKTQRNNLALSQKFLSASSPSQDQGSSSSMNDKYPCPIKENQYRQYPHSLIGLITFTNGKQTIKKATGVLVSSNLVITAAHTFLNIGKKCSFIYKRLAQHPLKNNKIEQMQKQFAASCQYSIRFHLEVPGQYRRTQGVEVIDWRYPAKYNGTNNSRQYNYVILKLAKPACAEGTKFMKPTVFKCEKCIQKLNQQQPLQVYGYNTKQGQQQDCFNKSIYQYGLGRQQCIQKVDFQKKTIIYEMAMGSEYIGSPLILNNFYIGFHVGKKQDNSSNNNGIIFTEQVVLDLTRYALEMGQNPFSREAKPICPHIDRQYDNRNEPIFDRLDFTREGMEDIQEVGHEKYPQLKHLYLSDNEFTWIDLTKNFGLLTLCIAQNLLMSIDTTVNKYLRYLDISNNQISANDVSQNIQLRTLLIANNKLSKIDVSRNSQLRKLMLQGNKLAQIDLSQNRQLKILSLAKNQLRQINISANTQITEIDLNNNQLQQIDLSANTQITQLGLRNNQLQQMNLSANTQITQLGLRNNQLKQIDLSANTQITEIDLNNNQLQQINLSANTQIALLELSNNQLQKINLSANSQITQLNLCNNQLQQLNLSANTQLTQLYLINNQLRQINLSANTQLTQLYLRNNKLQQINLSANTQIAQLDLSANALLQIDLSENHQLKELFLNANRLKQLRFHFNSEMMKQTSIGDLCRLNFQNSPFCKVQIIYNTEDEKIFMEFLKKLKEYTLKGNQQCRYNWKYKANGNTITQRNSFPQVLSLHNNSSFVNKSQSSRQEQKDGKKDQQQIKSLRIELEILIAKLLMATNANFLCKPIKIDEESKNITYNLGVPFEIKQKSQFLDLVFCVCEILKELVEFGIYHQDINLRNIIYAGSTLQQEYHKFMLINHGKAYLFFRAEQKANSTIFDISKRVFEQNKKNSSFSLSQVQPLICDMVQQAKMTLISAINSFPKEQMHELTQIVDISMAKSKLMLLSLNNQQNIGAKGDPLKQYEFLNQLINKNNNRDFEQPEAQSIAQETNQAQIGKLNIADPPSFSEDSALIQSSNDDSQIAINQYPLDFISQYQYSLFPHYLIGAITADNNGRPEIASGALVSPNLVITAAHAIFDRRQQQMYKNIRFHLAPKHTFKIEEGIQVKELKFTVRYLQDKKLDYALLKLSKQILLKEQEYLNPTIFGCSSCLLSKEKGHALKIYGYPIYKDNFEIANENQGTKIIRQYGLKGKNKIKEIYQQMNYLSYQLSTEQGQSGSPLIFGNDYIGIHTRRHGKKYKNNQYNEGVLFTKDSIQVLKQWAKQMNEIPFQLGAEHNCQKFNRPNGEIPEQNTLNINNGEPQLYTKQIIPADNRANDEEQQYDGPPLYRLDYTREDLEDIQEVGHQQYPNLKYLYLSENRFTSIDLTKNVGLQILHIEQNLLLSIDIRINEKLFYLDISSNQISSVDLSHNLQLRTLFIANNQLSKIELSQNSQLRRLMLQGNKLTQIDLSQNRQLKVLSLANNRISKLDLSSNQHLKELYLNHNRIETIQLKPNKELTSLFLNNNKIKQIDLTANNCITLLNLEFNDLSNIDLSHNLELQKLSLRNNKNLSNIDLSKHSKLIEAYLCMNEKPIIVDLKQQNAVAKRQKDPQIICDFSITSFNEYMDIQQQNQQNRFWQFFMRKGYQQRGMKSFMVNQYSKILYCQNRGLQQITIPPQSQLSELYLRGNSLEGTNLSSCSKITRLFLSQNKLTELDLMKCVSIQQVNVADNKLQSINLSTNTQITKLDLSYNKLQQINLSANTQITQLYLSNNQLQQINLSANTQITNLNLNDNKLQQINLSTNTQITKLDLSYNKLQQINLSANTQITQLSLSSNKLQQINLSSNTQIIKLDLSYNKLQQINLSANTQITQLYLSTNKLSQIDLSDNLKLQWFKLNGNQLEKIRLHFNSKIIQSSIGGCWLHNQNIPECKVQITYNTEDKDKFMEFLQKLKEDTLLKSNDSQGDKCCNYIWNYKAKEKTN